MAARSNFETRGLAFEPATRDEEAAVLGRIDALRPKGVPALPKIPLRGHYGECARLRRLEFLRQETGAPLFSLQGTTLVPEKLTKNIENMIGSVEVPVGIAGPLLFDGRQARGLLYAPLATTEGALVVSVTRGAKAISLSGGVTTAVLSQRMTRVPVFLFANLRSATRFCQWIRLHAAELRAWARQVSSHAELLSCEPILMADQVHLQCVYETGDAAGQNMTTSATWRICQAIVECLKSEPGITPRKFSVEANCSSDKKVSFRSFLSGRGMRVVAEAFIPRKTLQRVFKVTLEDFDEAISIARDSAIASGAIGFNINVANVVAAIFTATGQDIACTHESSVALLQTRVADDGLHAHLQLPSLIVGTVGGGTHLDRQNELLRMLGCQGEHSAERLAEVIAGFALALDLSTAAAVASGEFALAHERLGRNRPVRCLRREEIDPEFFAAALRRTLADPDLEVTRVTPLASGDSSHSIITELSARKVNKLLGLFPYRLEYASQGSVLTTNVMLKLKPTDEEVILMVNAIAGMCGRQIADAHTASRRLTGFVGCHRRELALYELGDPRLRQHSPRVLGICRDDLREIYGVVLELLDDVVLLDTADDPRGWQPTHVEAALQGIAAVHAIWYGRESELAREPWLGTVMTAEHMVNMSPLWDSLAAYAREEFPDWFTALDLDRSKALVGSLCLWWSEFERLPRTLVHNDFNPRNIALRREGAGFRLCAYDWELAAMYPPTHDLAELLCFVLDPTVRCEEVDHYVEFHRRALEGACGLSIDATQWRQGYLLSLRDLWVNRFAMHIMAHAFRHAGFVERSFRTLRTLLDLEEAALAAARRC